MDRRKPQPMDREAFKCRVAEGKGICLVCFMGQWSEPSRQMDPLVEDLTDKWYGILPVYVIDPDEEPFITAENSVTAVPTFIIFKDGQEIDRIVGIRTGEQLEKFVRCGYEG